MKHTIAQLNDDIKHFFNVDHQLINEVVETDLQDDKLKAGEYNYPIAFIAGYRTRLRLGVVEVTATICILDKYEKGKEIEIQSDCTLIAEDVFNYWQNHGGRFPYELVDCSESVPGIFDNGNYCAGVTTDFTFNIPSTQNSDNVAI